MTKQEPIYVSAHLPNDRNNIINYGKNVYDQLRSAEIKIIPIKNHKQNVWCRDYMPVKSASGKLVQFQYAPNYMTDSQKWKNQIPDSKIIHKELELNCDFSEIILDGGAIEVLGDKAILSDRVFRDNDKSEEEIIAEIVSKLELKRIIVVPQYPFDFTGHVDGMVRFVDEDTVVINALKDNQNQIKDLLNETNYYRTRLIENWYYAFKYTLINAGLKIEELPYFAHENDNDKSAKGIYLNFLHLPSLILMPAYNQFERNEQAKEKLEQLYGKKVIAIDAGELVKEGGIINCVTWTK